MAYVSITVEGGLFPPDVLDRLAAGSGPGQDPKDFGLDGGRLSDEIQSAFSDIRKFWDDFQRRLTHSRESTTTITRESWIIPLLERLGFDIIYQRAGAVIGGETFSFSHRAGDDPDAPPVHVVAIGQHLDRKEGSRRSPHALVQEYLNRSDALWGIVANGERLRLLRDSARLSRPTYLEFNLRGMIEGNLYSEFVILYRLLHRTRFPRGSGDAASCILEQIYQEGLDAGGRVREKLREGVERALSELGVAFLRHPDSEALRAAIESGQLDAVGYYRQLLRLVYRLLFLFVAEERRLIFPPSDGSAERIGGADGSGSDIYYRYYSVSRLRDRCERPFADDRFSDLWQGLLTTFRLFRDTDAARHLGLAPLDGDLFGPGACRDLEGAGCENSSLLRAIFHLSTFLDEEGETRGGGRRRRRRGRAVRRRVNYAALDVEELGSVYESLLDLRPTFSSLSERGEERDFRLIAGSERKQTGSYYTPPELVRELIESALVPVIEERLAAARTPEEKEQALLSLKICDPASGSGHFLLAAARRLGRELAKVRTGEAEPAPEAYRLAVRDVIRSCIYAVDKNPLAVDLCKVALWIEGHYAGMPLSFLDHHIKCGDSLVGVFDLTVLRTGIPDEAYQPVTGDDRKVATHLRRLNQPRSLDYAEELPEAPPDFAREFSALALLDERTADDVRTKEELYAQLHDREGAWWTWRRACTLWTAAFFAPLVENAPRRFSGSLAPLTEDVHRALAQPKSLNGEVVGQAEALAERLRFFHWPLEFPEVFAAGGFDVVLGNPPWERVKLQEQEFFAARDPEIASAPNAPARKRLIAQLPERNPKLAEAFTTAKRAAEATSKFLRGGRFPLTGRGDVNTYSVFSELMIGLVRLSGQAGVIVPTGIATDDTNKHFFGWLVRNGRLVSLFDFVNRAGLFPAKVDSRMKFSLLTMAGSGRASRAFEAAFFLQQPAELREDDRRFTLTAEEIELLNPNTRTCPIFRTTRDAEITKRIYRAAPVLVREGPPEVNPWGVTFKRMFDMSNDSHLFRTRRELEDAGYALGADGRFRGHGECWLPLYEAKMIHQFDHRFATFEGGPAEDRTRDVTPAEHADPGFVPLPRYWVEEREVEREVGSTRDHRGWLLGWRDIARNTDERTFISSVFPLSGAGDTLLIMQPACGENHKICGLLANLNAVVFDYATRQKVGGTHLKFFTVKQLPVLPPETYTPALLEEIVPRVLELVYTAHDLTPFARDCGYNGPPFIWDEERRARLRAELDGIYAHLYGLSRDDFAYIIGTFSALRNNEMRTYGEFRTERLCLEAYDRFVGLIEPWSVSVGS